VEVVHEHVAFCNSVGGGFGLLSGDIVESRKDAGVASAAVVEKSAADGLDSDGALAVK
jgi:hypothetical protein